jgi:hypothetical protein
MPVLIAVTKDVEPTSVGMTSWSSPSVRRYLAPLGHSTTRSVCSKITKSNSTEKFFT